MCGESVAAQRFCAAQSFSAHCTSIGTLTVANPHNFYADPHLAFKLIAKTDSAL